MKEATGELNITVITVVAIAAVAALFYLFVWPMIEKQLADNTCKSYSPNYEAVEVQNQDTGTKANRWQCCLNGQQGNNCVDMATVRD